MKNFVFVIVDENHDIVAIYSTKEVAEKLLPAIEKKVGRELKLLKYQIDPSIDIVG